MSKTTINRRTDLGALLTQAHGITEDLYDTCVDPDTTEKLRQIKVLLETIEGRKAFQEVMDRKD